MKHSKIVISLMLSLVLIFSMPVSVCAASSDSWDIDYYPSSPYGNQIDVLTLSYYSGGYYAYCNTMTGTNGRQVYIYSSSAGGMSTVYITTTGSTPSWRMYSSTTGNVIFTVTALSGYRCTSTGYIHIDD